MRISILLLMLLCCQTVAALPQVAAGKIENLDIQDWSLISPRTVQVWLPDGYDPVTEYKTLYMHDGQMLFDANQTWNGQEWRVDEVANQLIMDGAVAPFIVVAIDNGGAARHSEYFPQAPFSSLPEQKQTQYYALERSPGTPLFASSIYSDNYLKFIVDVLIPSIESKYSVGKNRQDRFVLGSSMGGLISMYALLEYPQVFGGAACLSTHWPGVFFAEKNPVPDAFLAYMDKKLPKPGEHNIYFDYGTETLDAMYPSLQEKVDALMREKGFTARHWQTLKFEGADHSEKAWAARLDIPLTFLFGI